MILIKFRLRKSTIISIVIGIVLCVSLAFMFGSVKPAINGKDTLDRVAYLSKLGYSVDYGSEIKTEIKIPQNFSNIYNEYNKTQMDAGFNLADFSGQNATMYSYSISEFKNCKEVYANLLIINGKIIGGDISSIENGGFTLPLVNIEKQ